MLLWRATLSIMLSALPANGACAQASVERPHSVDRQLRGLSAAEADALLDKLQNLQRRLRSGESLYFELLSGAPASYPATSVSPRDAFLQMSFERPLIVERVRTDNRLWQPYKLMFLPDGPGRLVWDVEVVLGITGDVERVTMLHTSPAPF